MNKNSILALDIATKCGWCLWNENKVTGGTWKLTSRAKEPDYQKTKNLWDMLETMHKFKLDCIVHEDVQFAKFRLAYASYNRFLGVVQLWCAINKVPLVGVGVKNLKKYATNNGNAPKELMLEFAAIKWLDENFVDDNHVDARWLLDYILNDGKR